MNEPSLSQHPWIEHHDEFEAVLLVKNTIQTWETNAIIRAFQLHQWDGIQTGESLETSDLSIAHAVSGTIVHYDGNVLAIDRGDSDLKDAFTDLFLVLRHLGWKEIEVYHSLASMGDLLQDMGLCIPASMEMNIFPFNAKSIVEKTSQAAHIQSIVSNAQHSALPPDQAEKLASQFKSFLPADDEPVLIPSLDSGIEDHTVTALPAAIDEPGIPLLDEVEASHIADLTPDTAPQLEVKVVAKTQDEVKQSAAPTPACKTQPCDASNMFMRIGKCVIGFDTPASPVSNIEALAHALKSGIPESQITHLRPGETNNSYHWNVLGEIPENSPWIAETLVQDMFPDEKSLHLIAALFLAAHNQTPNADLRQVLSIIADEEKRSAALSRLSPETNTFAGSLQFDLGKTGCINALGAIALVPAGKAFVDISGIDEGTEKFTVRELAAKTSPQMLMIHTDHLDSYFTHWIVDVMQKHAQRHLKSKRYFSEEDKDAPPLVVVDSAQLVDLIRQYQHISDSIKQMGLPIVQTRVALS